MSGFTGIHVDDFGWLAKLRIVEDAVAVDISGYATRQFIWRKPDATEVTKTATFVTDGTDGALEYTVEDGLIDAAGNWRVWAMVADGSEAELTSDPVRFYVSPRGS